MDMLKGNSKRRKVCDSVQAPGAQKASSAREGFQIEQSNEGGFRIVRIHNADTTSAISKKDSSKHETTPQPSQGKKRSRDEMHNGVNTIVDTTRATQTMGPSSEATSRLLQQSTGELHEDENIGISRQTLKRQLKKSAAVIIKMFTKRMNKVKSRMNKLEEENKELQQLASNLRDKLQNVIQQQKQKEVLMVSRGTQVSMRVVFRPVMPSNKDGAFPRFRDISCLHQNVSAGQRQFVYFPPTRDTSTYRSEERNHQHIRMEKASSAMPVPLVEGNTKSVSSGPIALTENITEKDEGCFSKSTDLIPNEGSTSSSPSVVTASETVPSIFKIPIERFKPGNLHPNAPLASGLVGTSPSNCSKTQHWKTNTASGVPHTKENELLSRNGCQSNLANIYTPSNTQEFIKNSNTVHSSSSNESSLVDAALWKLVSRSSETPKKSSCLPSSQKRNLDRTYSPAESFLPNTSSSLFSNGKRGLYPHLSPNKSQSKSATCGLPSQNDDVKQEHEQQETQFTSIPSSIPPCQERGHKESQGINTQSREKVGLHRPTAPKHCGLLPSQSDDGQQVHAQQETQFTNIPSSITPYKERGNKKSQGTNKQSRENSGLYRPTAREACGLPPSQNSDVQRKNAQQETQFMSIPSSILFSPTAPKRSRQHEEISSQETRLRSTPSSPLSRQEIGLRNGSSPNSRVTITASSPLSRLEVLRIRNESTSALCTSSCSSTHDRPNANIMEQSSLNFSGRRVPLQTGSSNLLTEYNEQSKPLQTAGPSKELSAKESRSLIAQKIVAETLEETYRHNTAPSKLLLRQKPFPLNCYEKMDIPVTTVSAMENGSASHANTPSKVIQHTTNSHEGSSNTPHTERSNTNKNYEGKTPTKLNSPQYIRNIQTWSHKVRGDRSNPKNRDRLQQNQKFKVANTPGPSTASPLSSFIASQRCDRSSDARLNESRNFNADFFNATENNLQAHQPENVLWYFQTEHSISEGYMHAIVDGDNESNKSMEIYGQSGVYSNTTEREVKEQINDTCKVLLMKSIYSNGHSRSDQKTGYRCSSKTIECSPRKNSFHYDGDPLSQWY